MACQRRHHNCVRNLPSLIGNVIGLFHSALGGPLRQDADQIVQMVRLMCGMDHNTENLYQLKLVTFFVSKTNRQNKSFF